MTLRRVLAGLPASEYHAAVYDWPLSDLLVWMEASAIHHDIEALKRAARA